MKCKACGDEFDLEFRAERLSRIGQTLNANESPYCRECADELFRGTISTRPARLFSSGPGCPHEPSETDSTPWQDNVIRAMEDA